MPRLAKSVAQDKLTVGEASQIGSKKFGEFYPQTRFLVCFTHGCILRVFVGFHSARRNMS